MQKRRIAGIVVAAVIAVLCLAQLVPYGPERGVPPSSDEPAWDAPRTRELAVRACFDCHSAETRWPWYAHVAPVSWLVRYHVDEGREHLDFSRWTDAPGKEPWESGETIREGVMPPGYYLFLHPDARLTDEDRAALAAGLDATIGTEEGAPHGGQREARTEP